MNILKFRMAGRMPLTKALRILRGGIAARLEVASLPDDLAIRDRASAKTAYAEYGFMTSAERTEALSAELMRHLSGKSASGHLEDLHERHDPDALIADLTTLRQVIDSHGISYSFFVVEAVRLFVNWNGESVADMPTVKQLSGGDVVERVVALWNGSDGSLSNEIDISRWDRRFFLRKFWGSEQHQRMLDAAAEQVLKIESAGGDGSRLLRRYLNKKVLTEAEATRRLGIDLVDRAAIASDPVQEAIESL